MSDHPTFPAEFLKFRDGNQSILNFKQIEAWQHSPDTKDMVIIEIHVSLAIHSQGSQKKSDLDFESNRRESPIFNPEVLTAGSPEACDGSPESQGEWSAS